MGTDVLSVQEFRDVDLERTYSGFRHGSCQRYGQVVDTRLIQAERTHDRRRLTITFGVTGIDVNLNASGTFFSSSSDTSLFFLGFLQLTSSDFSPLVQTVFKTVTAELERIRFLLFSLDLRIELVTAFVGDHVVHGHRKDVVTLTTVVFGQTHFTPRAATDHF